MLQTVERRGGSPGFGLRGLARVELGADSRRTANLQDVRRAFDTITFFVRSTLVHELFRSQDPTFQRLGEALQRDADVTSVSRPTPGAQRSDSDSSFSG